MLVRAYARRPFQGVWATALLAVDLWLEHADVRHIAVLLGVIQPVAHDELVGDLKAREIGRDGLDAAGGLIEQSNDRHALGAFGEEIVLEEVEGIAGVQNILDDHDLAARNVLLQVVRDLHHAGRDEDVPFW